MGGMLASNVATRAAESAEVDVGVQLDHIGERVTSSGATRVMGSEEAEGCSASTWYRPEPHKKRSHEGHEVRLRRRLQSIWGQSEFEG